MKATVYTDTLPPLGFFGIDLRKGSHIIREDGVCAMEAAAWLAGEPHSDRPQCVCPVLAAFVIDWNDALPSDEDRNRILKPFIPKLVGSRSTAKVEEHRSYLALDWLIRVYTPMWLNLRYDLKPHAATLRALDAIQDIATAEAAFRPVAAARAAAASPAGDAAWDAAGDAARAAAWDAAGAAAWDAARDAAGAAAGAAAGTAAGDAAGDAAWDAARAAAWDAAWAAAWDAARAAAWDAAGDAAWAAARDAARAAAASPAWDAARAAAWDAARDAAGAVLNPTVTQLQVSAQDLLTRMLAVKE
jgi:hypothetical protein